MFVDPRRQRAGLMAIGVVHEGVAVAVGIEMATRRAASSKTCVVRSRSGDRWSPAAS